MRRLFRRRIRKNGEGKGDWRKNPTKGGTRSWQPLLGSPMCPLGEGVTSGVLGALNPLSDPRWGRFGTGHYLACL